MGYPIFDLRSLRNPNGGRMGPVDFVRRMEEALIRLCGGFGVRAGRIGGLTGVWCGHEQGPGTRDWDQGPADRGCVRRRGAQDRRHRHSCGARHHFARVRLQRDHRPARLRPDRSLRHSRPCGNQSGARSCASRRRCPAWKRWRTRRRGSLGWSLASRCWRSRAWRRCGLRRKAAAARRNFPAEDTPLRVPAEVERLHGHAEGASDSGVSDSGSDPCVKRRDL